MNLIMSLAAVAWMAELVTHGPQSSARVGIVLLMHEITQRWPAKFRLLVVKELGEE